MIMFKPLVDSRISKCKHLIQRSEERILKLRERSKKTDSESKRLYLSELITINRMKIQHLKQELLIADRVHSETNDLRQAACDVVNMPVRADETACQELTLVRMVDLEKLKQALINAGCVDV